MAERVGYDLHVHPVPLVFAGVEQPVRGVAVDRQERAVFEDEFAIGTVTRAKGALRGPPCPLASA